MAAMEFKLTMEHEWPDIWHVSVWMRPAECFHPGEPWRRVLYMKECQLEMHVDPIERFKQVLRKI